MATLTGNQHHNNQSREKRAWKLKVQKITRERREKDYEKGGGCGPVLTVRPKKTTWKPHQEGQQVTCVPENRGDQKQYNRWGKEEREKGGGGRKEGKRLERDGRMW